MTPAAADPRHPLASALAPEVHDVLQRILSSARGLTGALEGRLQVRGTELSEVEPAHSHGRPDVPRDDAGTVRAPVAEPVSDPVARPAAGQAQGGAQPETVSAPVRVRDEVVGHLDLTGTTRGPFSAEDLLVAQALAAAAGAVVENAEGLALSEGRRRWLESAVRIGESLQPPMEIETALQQIVVAARTVTGGRAAAVVQEQEGETYRVTAVDGPAADRVTEVVSRLGSSIRRCIASATEQVLADRTGDEVVIVPLRARLEGPGVLVVLEDGSHSSAGDERELLVAFADQASLALDRARATDDRSQLALVSDRGRIARDLHDVVIQQLFAAGLQLRGASRLTQDHEALARMDQTVIDLDDIIRDIRSTIFDLQGRDRQTTRGRVRDLLEEYEPVLGFVPTLQTVGPVDAQLPEILGTPLVAALRDAVSNVARHAQATRLLVRIEVTPETVLLRVADDGVGTDATMTDGRSEGGLGSLRRSADELGGAAVLLRTEPHGTTVEWRVPASPAPTGVSG